MFLFAKEIARRTFTEIAQLKNTNNNKHDTNKETQTRQKCTQLIGTPYNNDVLILSNLCLIICLLKSLQTEFAAGAPGGGTVSEAGVGLT